PEYLEVVENPDDPKNPGTIARLWLRGLHPPGLKLTEPNRVEICGFEHGEIGWDDDSNKTWQDKKAIKREGGKREPCVLVYWPFEHLEPDATRHMAITYGLGKLDIGDLLAISAPSLVAPDKTFTLTAYVYNSKKGQVVTIDLPGGLELARGESEDKTVNVEAKRTQVNWKVRARKTGTYTIKVKSGKSSSPGHKLRVKPTGIFG